MVPTQASSATCPLRPQTPVDKHLAPGHTTHLSKLTQRHQKIPFGCNWGHPVPGMLVATTMVPTKAWGAACSPSSPKWPQTAIWPCGTHEAGVRKHQPIRKPLLATAGANKHLPLCQRLSWWSQEPGITTALSAHATHHSLRIQRVRLDTSRSRAERSLLEVNVTYTRALVNVKRKLIDLEITQALLSFTFRILQDPNWYPLLHRMECCLYHMRVKCFDDGTPGA